MESRPKFIISPLCQLFELTTVISDSINHQYNLVLNSPFLPQQWLIGYRYAITEDNNLYDLKTKSVIKVIGHPTSKFKRIVINTLIESIDRGYYMQMVLIDINDNLYQCGVNYKDELLIHPNPILNVVHCSIIHNNIIGYSTSSGWFSNRLQTGMPAFHLRNVPDSTVLSSIEESIRLEGTYIFASQGIYEIKRDNIIKLTEPNGVIDIMKNNLMKRTLRQKIALTNDGLLHNYNYEDKTWKSILSQETMDAIGLTPYIKLFPLNNGRIGALGNDGRSFSIWQGVIEDLDIPVELMVDRRKNKNGRNVAKVIDE